MSPTLAGGFFNSSVTWQAQCNITLTRKEADEVYVCMCVCVRERERARKREWKLETDFLVKVRYAIHLMV